MFKAEIKRSRTKWDSHIDRIVAKLTSSSKHLVHGRMITANGIKSDQDLKRLKLDVLTPNDPYWMALQDLLVRTEVVVQSEGNIGKVMFTRDMQLLGG